MEITTVNVDDLKSAKYNPRRDLSPPDPAYEKLKKSIFKFDYVDPIIWNRRTGNIVGGHQRLKILRDELHMTEVQVSVVDLDEHTEKQLNIALNKNTGEWDFPALIELLNDIDDGEIDFESIGFDEVELSELFEKYDDTEPDNLGDEFYSTIEVDDEDKFVNFKFGDYGGRVAREIYNGFVEIVQRKQSGDKQIMLSDILRVWLNVNRRQQ